MRGDDKVALFDMDGTIASYSPKLVEDLEKISAPSDGNLIYGDLHGDDLPEWFWQRMKMVRSQPGWWEGLLPISSGLGLIKFCKEVGFKNMVLTKGPRNSPNAWTEKFNWCINHVKPVDPTYGITITEDKSLSYGRILVDDFPGYMIPWLENRPRGLGLMPKTRDNGSFNHPRVHKYDPSNWRTPELEERIREAYERIAG